MKIGQSVISMLLNKKVYQTGGSPSMVNIRVSENKLIILFFDPDSSTLSKQSYELLGNILKAIGLNIEHITIFNVADENIGLSSLVHSVNPDKLICFGVGPRQIHVNIEHLPYKAIQLSGVTMLFADTLEVIGANVEKKKMLWTELQKIFKKS